MKIKYIVIRVRYNFTVGHREFIVEVQHQKKNNRVEKCEKKIIHILLGTEGTLK